jgi:ring-1,2-phenylacetyl-CoA epoxidase subunit PaaD
VLSATPDLDAVRDAVASVPDPELPPVTIGMLGMLHDVRVEHDGWVVVELLPTFSGCPAMEVIARDVSAAVERVPGVTKVDVRFSFDPPWNTGRISRDGHRALERFGIAPPMGEKPAADRPARRASLPIFGLVARPTPCPYCGSTDTQRDSPFGPTPCRALHYCNACRQPFEAFKDL